MSNPYFKSAAALTGVLAIAVTFAISGNEAAVWIVGWGLLFFGLPLTAVILGLLALGFASRWRARQTHDPTRPKGKYLPWALYGLSTLLILTALPSVLGYASVIIRIPEFHLFHLLGFLHPMLILGFALGVAGRMIQRWRPMV